MRERTKKGFYRAWEKVFEKKNGDKGLDRHRALWLEDEDDGSFIYQ